MKAKEMFEELGYELYEETDIYMSFRKYPDTIADYGTYQEIFFNTQSMFFVIAEYRKGKLEEKFMTTKELKAINKQVEELGWNKEKK